ncbi:MAG: AEC family transporter [Proteobacteria bacterium]|nr:AEC family transporter [Pseudomonadota bacterium]
MSAIALNVAPIFILILVGWTLARTGFLKASVGDGLGEFVFKVAVPMLMFRTLAEADFHGASPFRLWAAYFAGVGITWAVAHLVARHIFGRDEQIGVIAGVSAAFANNVFIGLPLVGRSVGDEGLVALSILLAIHLPVMMIIGTILMENATHRMAGGEKQGILAILKQIGRNLVTNPLVIGLVAGLAFNLSGLPLTPVGKTVVDQIAGIAGAAALISLGMSLTRYSISGNLGISTAMTLLKLFLMPACVYAAAKLLGLPPSWVSALVLTSSVPTGVNAWLIANRFGAGQSLAASTISITTLFGVLSVSFWAWLLAS